MKTLGIIGGIGPESTIEYYRQVVSVYRERSADGTYPSIVINSIDLNKLLKFVADSELEALTAYLRAEVQKLALAGAHVGLLAANTPHVVFEELSVRTPIPLVSIVEATRDAAAELGLKRLGLFGTRFIMQGRFYPDVFSRAGMTLVVPNAAEQTYIHEKYMTELIPGKLVAETRGQLTKIVRRMKLEDGIDALILGGTELPLILRDTAECGIPFLDTTAIHVRRAVSELLA
jgi:aspartate racemase